MTHRLLLPIALPTLALLLAATTVAAQDYGSDPIAPLRCESQFNKTQQCPIEGRMRLARQLSVTRCVEDQNWGQSRRMLWVTDGCRAEFVADGQGRGRWPGRGRDRDRDDDGERLVCESYEQKDKECRIRVRHEVRLVKQKSVTPCVEDRNWGWDRRGVWVSDGGWEYNAIQAALGLMFLVYGSGRAGLDNLFVRPRDETDSLIDEAPGTQASHR